MKSSNSLVALALLATACGRPLASIESGGENGNEGDSTSSSSTTTETSATETGTTETSTTETESGSPSFVTEFDLANPDECDSFLQDCPEGEKCVPYSTSGDSWDANHCVPVLGDQAPGEPCTYSGTSDSLDDCDASGFCWDVNEQSMGICHAVCTGTPSEPECPEGSACFSSGSLVINLCIPRCDPLLQDCGEGQGCYYDFAGSFICASPADDIPPGGPCGFLNECALASVCLDAGYVPNCADVYCCTPFCLLGGDGQECAVLPGTTCVSFFQEGMAPPNYDHVGVCILP